MAIEVQNTIGLVPYILQIEVAIKETLQEVESKLNVADVLIVVKETKTPEDIKDIGGVGGYCPDGNRVEISIDVDNPEFQKNWEQLIRRTLVHELHHVARRQAVIAIGEGSFLECLVSEGMADYFVFEITNSKAVWVVDLAPEIADELLARAKEIFDEPMTDKLY